MSGFGRQCANVVWFDLAVIDELVAPTFVGHSAGVPDVKGPEGVKQRATRLRTAFPDLQITV